MALYNYVYLDLRARGETPRLILHYAGVPFIDDRDYWLDDIGQSVLPRHGRLPFGRLPVLEFIDGRKTLAQSRAIVKFLANEHGLAPSTGYERARADMVVDQIKDVEDILIQLLYHSGDDLKRKESDLKTLHGETIPALVEDLNILLEENNGGKVGFAGEKISYADLDFFAFFNNLILGKLEVPEQLKKYPLLVDLYNRVMNTPNVLNYLNHRKPNRFNAPF